jgi:hypothetical protein
VAACQMFGEVRGGRLDFLILKPHLNCMVKQGQAGRG